MTSPTTDRRLGLQGGTAIKAPVDCATTVNITLSGEQTIDTVATSSSRVLVKNQTNGVENGIYRSSTGAWTREPDADGTYDFVRGTLVGIAGGAQAFGIYQITTTGTITPGTTSITFAVALTSQAVSAYMQTLLAAANAAAARALLVVAPRATRIDVASAATTDITANAPNTDDIRLTGTAAIAAFTIASDRVLRVTANGAFTLTNNASIVTNTGSNIIAAAGDTFILRATAANTVEVLNYVQGTLMATVAALVTSSTTTTPPVRQTVISGPVDSAGLPNFGGATGSTTVTASGTLIATAAFSTGNRNGTTTNPSWTGLSAISSTYYLYMDINADGTCTTGSTTLQPVYQWGGAYSTTNGQFTFNIQEMTGKVGSGAAATQAYRVFVGEAVTGGGGTVTSITWYALMGRYIGAWTATLPAAGVATSFNHNIGLTELNTKLEVQCTTAEFGFSVGDTVTDMNGNTGGVAAPISVYRTYKTIGFTVSNTGSMLVLNKTTGANATMTLASWKYRMLAIRSW